MKRKLSIPLLLLAVLFGVVVFNMNAVSANGVDETDKAAMSFEEVPFEEEEVSPKAKKLPLQKRPPLTQEEYDDLISQLPEGAVIVGDVEVMPGVVK
ncbi:MAG: hypothetical protein LBM95_06250 [Lactobacillales bacterium]|nr:hypothetical protein [Lactobacillales bacterium]